MNVRKVEVFVNLSYNSPQLMKYPEVLVHQYGAKAGLLMYVAKELPDIPQAAMVVSEIGEPTDDFLKRADKAPILWPRIFRSSAVAELDGYEGAFPTKRMDSFEEGHKGIVNPNYYGPYRSQDRFDRHIRETINWIRASTRRFKEDNPGTDLPDEINVIIAEESPSEYVGTLIKHPNRPDYYLIATTLVSSLEPVYPGSNQIDPRRSAFYYDPAQEMQELQHFSQGDIKLTSRVEQDLKTVISWYERIAKLPEMDKNYTYQLEFGIDPPCLYQVRPFLEKCKAGFKFKPSWQEKLPEYHAPLIFGVTSLAGINVRVETKVYERNCSGEKINPDNQPSVYVDELRSASFHRLVPNIQAVILENSLGILAHRDVGAISGAKVAALYTSGSDTTELKQGNWVNIVSDGTRMRVKRIKELKL